MRSRRHSDTRSSGQCIFDSAHPPVLTKEVFCSQSTWISGTRVAFSNLPYVDHFFLFDTIADEIAHANTSTRARRLELIHLPKILVNKSSPSSNAMSSATSDDVTPSRTRPALAINSLVSGSS